MNEIFNPDKSHDSISFKAPSYNGQLRQDFILTKNDLKKLCLVDKPIEGNIIRGYIKML